MSAYFESSGAQFLKQAVMSCLQHGAAFPLGRRLQLLEVNVSKRLCSLSDGALAIEAVLSPAALAYLLETYECTELSGLHVVLSRAHLCWRATPMSPVPSLLLVVEACVDNGSAGSARIGIPASFARDPDIAFLLHTVAEQRLQANVAALDAAIDLEMRRGQALAVPAAHIAAFSAGTLVSLRPSCDDLLARALPSAMPALAAWSHVHASSQPTSLGSFGSTRIAPCKYSVSQLQQPDGVGGVESHHGGSEHHSVPSFAANAALLEEEYIRRQAEMEEFRSLFGSPTAESVASALPQPGHLCSSALASASLALAHAEKPVESCVAVSGLNESLMRHPVAVDNQAAACSEIPGGFEGEVVISVPAAHTTIVGAAANASASSNSAPRCSLLVGTTDSGPSHPSSDSGSEPAAAVAMSVAKVIPNEEYGHIDPSFGCRRAASVLRLLPRASPLSNSPSNNAVAVGTSGGQSEKVLRNEASADGEGSGSDSQDNSSCDNIEGSAAVQPDAASNESSAATQAASAHSSDAISPSHASHEQGFGSAMQNQNASNTSAEPSGVPGESSAESSFEFAQKLVMPMLSVPTPAFGLSDARACRAESAPSAALDGPAIGGTFQVQSQQRPYFRHSRMFQPLPPLGSMPPPAAAVSAGRSGEVRPAADAQCSPHVRFAGLIPTPSGNCIEPRQVHSAQQHCANDFSSAVLPDQDAENFGADSSQSESSDPFAPPRRKIFAATSPPAVAASTLALALVSGTSAQPCSNKSDSSIQPGQASADAALSMPSSSADAALSMPSSSAGGLAFTELPAGDFNSNELLSGRPAHLGRAASGTAAVAALSSMQNSKPTEVLTRVLASVAAATSLFAATASCAHQVVADETHRSILRLARDTRALSEALEGLGGDSATSSSRMPCRVARAALELAAAALDSWRGSRCVPCHTCSAAEECERDPDQIVRPQKGRIAGHIDDAGTLHHLNHAVAHETAGSAHLEAMPVPPPNLAAASSVPPCLKRSVSDRSLRLPRTLSGITDFIGQLSQGNDTGNDVDLSDGADDSSTSARVERAPASAKRRRIEVVGGVEELLRAQLPAAENAESARCMPPAAAHPAGCSPHASSVTRAVMRTTSGNCAGRSAPPPDGAAASMQATGPAAGGIGELAHAGGASQEDGVVY